VRTFLPPFLPAEDISPCSLIIIIIIIIQYLHSAMKPEDTEALGGGRLREVK